MKVKSVFCIILIFSLSYSTFVEAQYLAEIHSTESKTIFISAFSTSLILTESGSVKFNQFDSITFHTTPTEFIIDKLNEAKIPYMVKEIPFEDIVEKYGNDVKSKLDWIVTSELDTIYGYVIKDEGDEIKFQNHFKSKTEIIDKENLNGYKLKKSLFTNIDGMKEIITVGNKLEAYKTYYYGTGYANTHYKVTVYHIKRQNENKFIIVDMGTLNNTFNKKKMGNYFSDCPELVNKIEKGKFRKSDMIEIVEFYNSNCH